MAVILVALTGCTPSEVTRDYSRCSGCPQDKIEVSGVGYSNLHNEKYRASGCGQSAEYICGNQECSSPQVVVTKRHASLFSCNVKEIHVDYLEGGSWRSAGCGHQMTFNCFETKETLSRCIAETEEHSRAEKRGSSE
jgi:hypothetical protein